MDKLPRYWIIWNYNGFSPTVIHTDPYSANAEAKKLAACNPGQRFDVLMVCYGFKAKETPLQEIKYEDEYENECENDENNGVKISFNDNLGSIEFRYNPQSRNDKI